MILPRYSIRMVLYLAVVVALVAVVTGQAVKGAIWAIALSLGIASFALCWLVFVIFYGIALGFARVALADRRDSPQGAYYPELRRDVAIPSDNSTSSSNDN